MGEREGSAWAASHAPETSPNRRRAGHDDCSLAGLLDRGTGRDLLAVAERLDLEGIVAKRRAYPYRPETVCYKIKSRTYTQGEGRRELFQRRTLSRSRVPLSFSSMHTGQSGHQTIPSILPLTSAKSVMVDAGSPSTDHPHWRAPVRYAADLDGWTAPGQAFTWVAFTDGSYWLWCEGTHYGLIAAQ